jgi:predicted Zn finger-like uncharacterized protein
MLTECPSCQTRYDIEDRLLRRRGRRIRCSVCDSSWYLLPPDSRRAIVVPPVRITAPLSSISAPFAPFVVPPLSPITGSRVTPAERRPLLPRFNIPATLLRTGSIALVLAVSMSAIGFRRTIVRHLPAAGLAYAAVGLPVNLRGLEFRDLTSKILTDNGRRLLTVEGVIAQVGGGDANVPDVRVAIRDPSGREIYSWTTPAPRQKLARGETTPFRARLAAPPSAGSDIRVQFADASSP